MHVTHLSKGALITATIGYNADGERDRYTVVMSGTAIDDERFSYRGDGLGSVSAVTATLNADGSVKSKGAPYTDTFIYGPSGEPLEFLRQQNGATSRYFYALDGHGSVVAVTDATGTVVDRYGYDLWGEAIGKDYETVPQQLRYRGYWWDGELEWNWLGGRYYDPEDLRFLQPDPSDQDGVHTYAYALDDPVDYSDPMGYWPSPLDVSHRAVQGGKALLHATGTIAYATWDLVAGGDIHTLCCTSKPWRWDKTIAAVNIASLFFPPDALAAHGGMLAVKLGLKAGAHAGLGAVVIKLMERVGLKVGKVDEAAIEQEIRNRAEVTTEDATRGCTPCFAAGTLVATPRGERAIETLHVGDKVLSENPKVGTVEPEAVQAIIVHPATPALAVKLGDGSAITATVNHPFWVDAGASKAGWLEAGRLRVGYRLRAANGTEVVVVGLRSAGRVPIYTLTIAKDHTFFVGSAQVLAHNASPSCELGKALKAANHAKPASWWAAHHIVPWDWDKLPEGQQLRAKLASLGIGVNEAANGVWLPQTAWVDNPTGAAVHDQIHTYRYIRYVWSRHQDATNTQEAVLILADIARRLEASDTSIYR